MKTKIIAIIVGATLAQHSYEVFGAPCTAIVDCTNNYNDTIDNTSGCATKIYQCYQHPTNSTVIRVASCITCASSNATLLRNQSITVTGCSNVKFTTCECSTCTSCTASESAWSSASTGYEKKTKTYCDCGKCITDTSYRCAAGYYGKPTNDTSGCTKCPSSGGVAGQSAAGFTAITSCYIPANTTLSDTTGSYQYTSNCYYSN